MRLSEPNQLHDSDEEYLTKGHDGQRRARDVGVQRKMRWEIYSDKLWGDDVWS
jgi:hypothetical protein